MDDQRNTDDAWVETVTWHFHDETGETLADFEFEVGSDITLCPSIDFDEGSQTFLTCRESETLPKFKGIIRGHKECGIIIPG